MGGGLLGPVAKYLVIMLPSKTPPPKSHCEMTAIVSFGIEARRLRGRYEKGKGQKRGKKRRRAGREERRVRHRGEGGVPKLSAEEKRSEGWCRRGWRMMQEGEPIVLLT